MKKALVELNEVRFEGLTNVVRDWTINKHLNNFSEVSEKIFKIYLALCDTQEKHDLFVEMCKNKAHEIADEIHNCKENKTRLVMLLMAYDNFIKKSDKTRKIYIKLYGK